MTDRPSGGWTDVTLTAAPSAAPHPAAPAYDHELVATHREGAVVFLEPADPSPAAALDLLVETVCDLLEVDYAGVHAVHGAEHRILSGSDATFQPRMPATDSLCGVLLARHVRAGAPALRQVIEVRDTAEDPTLPQAVHGAGDAAPIRFYAAAPLHDDDGHPLGTLCVIARHPRTLTGTERRTLLLLGVAASTVLTRWRAVLGG